jgi:hypothetical protein
LASLKDAAAMRAANPPAMPFTPGGIQPAGPIGCDMEAASPGNAPAIRQTATGSLTGGALDTLVVGANFVRNLCAFGY